MEREYPTETVIIEYICDTCSIGAMKPTGKALLCKPPLYVHKCDSCGVVANLRRGYPMTKQRKKEHART